MKYHNRFYDQEAFFQMCIACLLAFFGILLPLGGSMQYYFSILFQHIRLVILGGWSSVELSLLEVKEGKVFFLYYFKRRKKK